MPLRFRLKTPSPIPIEVDRVRLEKVREQSLDAVKAMHILHGKAFVALGELFDVSGSAGDGEIIWEGDCSSIKRIGMAMTVGRHRVEGHAGMHLGAEMRGGEIEVGGDTGDWTGAEMRGGRIRIRGNAGNLLGSPYPGGRRGMRGGEIIVDGNTGREAGRAMRRGVIAIGGRCGDAPGYQMIAGSMLLFGACGRHPGAGMRRGTIACMGGFNGGLLPTFRFACVYRPVFLRLYTLRLANAGFPVPRDCLDADYRRYSGDFLELGKGEILIRNLH